MWVGEVRTRLSAFTEAVQKLADRAHMEQRHVDHVLALLRSLEARLRSGYQTPAAALDELAALEIEINRELGEL